MIIHGEILLYIFRIGIDFFEEVHNHLQTETYFWKILQSYFIYVYVLRNNICLYSMCVKHI